VLNDADNLRSGIGRVGKSALLERGILRAGWKAKTYLKERESITIPDITRSGIFHQPQAGGAIGLVLSVFFSMTLSLLGRDCLRKLLKSISTGVMKRETACGLRAGADSSSHL